MGTNFSPTISVDEIAIESSLSPLGIELIQSTSEEGVVAKAIQRGGEGLYALSFKVQDLETATAELESLGIRVAGRVEVGNIKEVQFHPADTYGFMLELCQYDEQHAVGHAALDKK